MSTIAKVQGRLDSHFYSRDGLPRYEIIGKTTGRPRPVTIRDARENDWLPSTTTILKVLHKQALVEWLCEQAALAVLTTPRKEGEELDAFVHRVLHEEKQQDQEAQAARDLGTAIHAAIELALGGKPFDPELEPFVSPAIQAILKTGSVQQTERIVVGDRYAGKLDALTQGNGCATIWDVKTSRNLPKYGSYDEHRLQTASYAKAFSKLDAFPIHTANVYVSTSKPGEIKVDTQQDWEQTYERGFKPLVDVWYWLNNLNGD
jgi:hypothetical protein